MANSNYTFSQVVNGTGFFSKSQDTGFSQGVKDLQTYLKGIGYTINDTSGRFQTDTETAVKGFQAELGTTVDGSAGPGTCKRLDTVRSSKYFTTYGKPITNDQWGTDNILAGKFTDIDLLARIILAESGYTNLEDQKGVALVIKNRKATSGYFMSGKQTWAGVVGMHDANYNVQYDSARAGNSIAQTPRRGYAGKEADGFVDPGWKNAVDIAEKLTKGLSFTATGYLVSGTTVGTTRKTVSNQLNQGTFSAYKSFYNRGQIKAGVNVIAFSSSGSGANVVFTVG